ncbi:uncharacterized protein LOC106171821 [Lingula anatina]|uniref:Uncharacterized protein LOC106171821 n=1 Tax=Lingula anatina TaxID=7574 RepID=A0A1S3JBP9_LINAN|nr:uncharacterized protein LOC106171821 [Lingula anatina]|eukprot:XP_013407748.1 uncharacterized protein LOC106171821 [Lingula anatina]
MDATPTVKTCDFLKSTTILEQQTEIDRLLTELNDLETTGTRMSQSKYVNEDWKRNKRCQAKKSLALAHTLIAYQRDPISEGLLYYDNSRKAYQDLQDVTNEGKVALIMGQILYKHERWWPAKVYFLSSIRLLMSKIESGDYSEKEKQIFVCALKGLAKTLFSIGLAFKFTNAVRLMELYSKHEVDDPEVLLCLSLAHAVNAMLKSDHRRQSQVKDNIEQFQICMEQACEIGDMDYELAIALIIKERFCHGNMYEEAMAHIDHCFIHATEHGHDIQAELICAMTSIFRTVLAHDKFEQTNALAMDYIQQSSRPNKRCQIKVFLGRHIVSIKHFRTHPQETNIVTSDDIENNKMAEVALGMAREIVDPILTCTLLKNLGMAYIRVAHLTTEPTKIPERSHLIEKAGQYLCEAEGYAKMYRQKPLMAQIETLLLFYNILKTNQFDKLPDNVVETITKQVEEYDTYTSEFKSVPFRYNPHGILARVYTLANKCPEKVIPHIKHDLETSSLVMTGDDSLNRSILKANKITFQLFNILHASHIPDEDRVSQGLELLEAGRAQAFLKLLHQRHHDFNQTLSDPGKMSYEEIANSLRTRGLPTLIYMYQPYDKHSSCVTYNGKYIGLTSLQLPDGGYSVLQRAIVTVRNAVVRNHKTAEGRAVELKSLQEMSPLMPNDVIEKTDETAFASDETSPFFTGAGLEDASVLKTEEETSISMEWPDTRCKIPDFEEDDYSNNNTYSALHCLYSSLIKPMVDRIECQVTNELLVIPMDELFLVPFTALQDEDGKYLGNKYQVRLTPSIQALDLVSAKANQDSGHNPTCLLVGNPDVGEIAGKVIPSLPFAEKEVKLIASWLNTEPLVGKQATKPAVLSKMVGATLIHIATHGSSKDGSLIFAPDLSHSPNKFTSSHMVQDPKEDALPSPNMASSFSGALTQSRSPKVEDCIVTIEDVMSLKLEAKLVVLSACNTGRGDISADGVFGISRAFMAAGALSVLVTLWAIPDEATKIFMEHFYSHLKAGDTVSRALQSTRIAMQQNDRFSHPMNWGSFQLIGDNPRLFPKGIQT